MLSMPGYEWGNDICIRQSCPRTPISALVLDYAWRFDFFRDTFERQFRNSSRPASVS